MDRSQEEDPGMSLSIMIRDLLTTVVSGVPALHAKLDGWGGWPFSGYGYEGGFWPVVARMAFVLCIFGGIVLTLRLLFGPKGPLRGKGWETIQEAKARREKELKDAENRPKS